MPNYKYRATDARGKNVKGSMTAAEESELYEKLKAQELYLITAEEVVNKRRVRPLKPQAIADFCRELGTLLGAGVSLVRALGMIAQNDSIKPREQAVYAELLRVIRQGTALSEAMEVSGAFPTMMIHMFRAAEAAGNMDQTAVRMAEHYTKEHRLNSKIKSSTLYPKFLCFMIVVVVAILIGYVLPQFESMFAMMEELPLPTRILYAITGFVTTYWYGVIAGIVCGVLAIRAICSIGAVRLRIDKMKIHLPVFGKLLKIIYTARFSRTLSSLYTAGIPLVTALQISRNSIGNTYIDKQFDTAVPVVRGGGNLSEAIDPIDGFVKKLSFSIKVGEETGSLDVMLNSVADALEFESDGAISRMVAFLEPALIIVMALIVGFIMIAVMMPIYASYNAIGASAYN
ncbi:MAG: type II secretion system F family protein [Lachnospiraceae bacterium]|nr:type II secretion system F family protein [Lachnospiraceae bacterium]